MEKAVKQRLVGGLVLIAGAALFLPMLLEGTGADLTVPPLPAPPVVAGVEALQPQLAPEIQAANQSVDEAQAQPEFHEVAPVAAEAGVVETPPDDAYKLAETPATPVAPVAAAASAAKPAAVIPPAQDKQTTAQLAVDKAAAEAARLAAQKADAERLAREKAVKERLARLDAEKKALAAKQGSTQPVIKPVVPAAVATKPAANLPEAWVVQVASLSARSKADELVVRLRSKGYRAAVVHQSGMWKVLVGPELRKEVAESIKQRLATDPELHLSGWVQAWKP